uniref:J domain-containing protein n=1 Tax=Strongyloides venezuelensis TaxID=75913 RepID=A0A0K0FQ87_STRVS
MNLGKPPHKLRIFLTRLASYDIKKKTHYEILGIPKTASTEEIKRAFFEKSRELHPDGDLYKDNGNKSTVDKSHWSYRSRTDDFMDLKNAYDVLRRSDKRKEYDSMLFDIESKDGYLYPIPSNDGVVGGILSNSIHTGAPSPRASIRNMDGHFFDPNNYFKREEDNKRYFRYGMTVTLIFILANILFVSYQKKKKTIVDEYKRRLIFMLLKRNGIWRFIREIGYSANKSYYEILGVSEKATKKEIKDKFYELSKKYHPDVNNGDKSENSKIFRDISQAYETLKNDDKRAQYDMSRGFGGRSNVNNPFWQQNDFSQYQNPNGGYFYRTQTFYYGPNGKENKARSTRYTQAEFEEIWRRFHKQVNSEQHKEYEKYQKYIYDTLWKEYEKHRKEAWEKRKQEFNKNYDSNFFYSTRDGKEQTIKGYKININENLLARISVIFIIFFFVKTMFQIFTEDRSHNDVMRNKDIPGQQQPYNNGENFYTPVDLKNIPTKVDAPPTTTSNIDPSMMPYGMPK